MKKDNMELIYTIEHDSDEQLVPLLPNDALLSYYEDLRTLTEAMGFDALLHLEENGPCLEIFSKSGIRFYLRLFEVPDMGEKVGVILACDYLMRCVDDYGTDLDERIKTFNLRACVTSAHLLAEGKILLFRNSFPLAAIFSDSPSSDPALALDMALSCLYSEIGRF